MKMKACLLLTLLVLVGAIDDFNTNEIKKRMKLIGGIPSYGIQNSTPKTEDKAKGNDVEYTEPQLNLNYRASSSFNTKGMGHLFWVTRFFMDHIEPNDTFPEGLVVDDENSLSIENVKEKWPIWLEQYLGIVIIAGVGLVFALIMPVVGVCFCCCRLGGKCGAKPKHEKQHDSCKRTTIAIMLSGVSVLILFGVVCAFVTNEHLKEGLEQLTDNATENLNDVKLYLNNTELEVDHLLIVNFGELKKGLDRLINNVGEIVKNQLAVASRAIALTNLTNLVSGLEVIKQDLTGVQIATRRLQELARNLKDFLEVTRGELLTELHNCRDIPACRELLNHRHIAELKVVENFNELPDVAQTFAVISRLLGDHDSFDSIQRKVIDARERFDNLRYEIAASVEDLTPEWANAIKKIGTELEDISFKIKRQIQEVRVFINGISEQPLSDTDLYIKEYGEYRYYLGLGVSGALLLILLCLTFGLLCGICGKRPEEMYSDDSDCCNTHSGKRFLILAVWLIFQFSLPLMLIILAHFLFGVTTDMVVCEPLKNPTDNKFFQLVDERVKLSHIYKNNRRMEDDPKISEILIACHRNQAIYRILRLEKSVDIDKILEYLERFNLPKKIQEFKDRLILRSDGLLLLPPDVKVKLKNLAQSSLNDIHFEKYAQLLNVQITNINLTKLSYELLTNAEKIPDNASSGFDLTRVKKLLRAKARFLELLERDSVAQIRNEIQLLKGNVSTLREHLKFNHTSLKIALESLLDEVEGAQLYLRQNGTNQLRVLVDEFTEDIYGKVKAYLDRVISKTKNDIGKGAPISNAYNATVVAGCNRIMDVFNGFWVSVGWSLLLFIPVLILSVKLANLYSKSVSYGPPGMYGESEYLYDAYADRDNMPLAMAQSEKKKKNHHKNYQESFDNGGNGAYLQDYSAHLGRSDRASASNDARYTDMAPKHWGDFSNSRGNSNPPRYHHHTSTEYERPPPYYYPGPERT